MTIQEEVEFQRDLKLEAYKTIDALQEENKRLRQGQNALKKVLYNKEIHKHAIVCPDSCGGVLEATDIIGEAKCNECGTYFTID